MLRNKQLTSQHIGNLDRYLWESVIKHVVYSYNRLLKETNSINTETSGRVTPEDLLTLLCILQDK